jgi:beta-glucosidase
MNLFEQPFAPNPTERDRSYRTPSDTAVALRSARESLVLLHNDGALPLRPDIGTLAVIGCHAASARFFFGGYTHFSMAEGKLAVNSSMAGLTTRSDDLTTITDTVPGTSIEASDGPAYDELLRRQQPGIRSLLDELRVRLPDTEVTWAYGYPFAGDDDSGHDDAIATAADADVVLLTLGGKHGTASIAAMGEGIDATNINLPPCQEELIAKLAQLGKPIIGVHLDGRPVSSDAADTHLAALLEAWSPAEGGAEAIVDVLTGARGPSGRLPVSVARNAGQVPIYYNHPHGSAWDQGESIGFRDYVDAPHTPRYCFGHGLSYTSFEYSGLELSSHDVEANDTIDITLAVTNTGDRPGTEVVQLYLSDRFASVSRPVLELAGFRRVSLEPGQTAQVAFRLDISQIAFLDADLRWRVEAGEVHVMVGASSDDLRLTDTMSIRSDALVDGATRGFFAV